MLSLTNLQPNSVLVRILRKFIMQIFILKSFEVKHEEIRSLRFCEASMGNFSEDIATSMSLARSSVLEVATCEEIRDF